MVKKTGKTTKKPKVKIVHRFGAPMKLPPFWVDFARAAGSLEALSQEIGKSVRQVRRLAHRESPLTGSTLIAVRAAAEKHGMLRALEEWARATR